ncbi:MAG TPA: ATP-binding protein [Candidatus Binatia bacterium]|jgi:signal transduction histidine kinase
MAAGDAPEVRDADIEREVDAQRAQTITVRLRLLIAATIGIVLMFLLTNPPAKAGSALPFVTLRLGALASLSGFFALTYWRRFRAIQLPSAMVLAMAVAGLSSVGGILRHDVAVAATLHIILMLMMSAVLPWGVLYQAVLGVLCALWMALIVRTLGVPSPEETSVLILINQFSATLLSLFVAQQTRSAFDRGARENLRLRIAEERNRLLNEQLEAKVRIRTAELEDALADQRAVARAISHDLRQPLRHIEGYASLLEEDLGDALGTDNRDRLERVRTATSRMWRMVDSLLVLSRISVRAVERRSFDISDCAAEIGDELGRGEPVRRVEFRITPGLIEDCDRELMRILMRELLANAWKFTRTRASSTIEVGRNGSGYFVRDNGTGFEMQHSRRMFRAFERLHHTAEFEGEGMGLAICDRIVRRHGGRIWAESEPEEGATFYFTLHGDENGAPAGA